MSKHSELGPQVTVKTLQKRKQDKQKISMITCYDAAFGGIIDHTGIDMILVGDSMANAVLGMKNTLTVSMDMMVHHTAAVSRSVKRAMVIADMPFMSYNVSLEDSLRNAARLIQEGGATGVKVEGGHAIVPQVKAMVQAGIPVVAHLGLTPQSINTLGGYKVQGRGTEGERLLKDAKELQDAGVCALVLELVPAQLAKDVTESLTVPTIGIGAGPDTDGQVLVLHDMLGFPSDFNAKFVKKYASLGDTIAAAVAQYDQDVKGGQFPAPEHTFQ